MKIFTYIFLAVMVLFIECAFVHRVSNGWNPVRFNDMIEGKAYKPFVTRCLVPIVVKNLSDIIPADVHSWINQIILEYSPKIFKILRQDDVPGVNLNSTYFLICCFIWYASFLGFALIMKKLLDLFHPSLKNYSLIFSASVLFALPMFFQYDNQIYDPSAIFLFTLCLYLMVSKKWIAYFIAFTIATINKETSILLIFIFLFYFKDHDSPKQFRFLASQIMIFILIRGIIALNFADNTDALSLHLVYTAVTIVQSPFSFFAGAAIILGLVLYNWQAKHLFLRIAFITIALIMIPMAFLFGNLDEFRNYYEAFPVTVLLSIPISQSGA